MTPDLPPDLLRTFVALVETGTATLAAERVGRSQPAVSLQMRRLQELVGRPLLRRQGRRLALTATGETVFGFARRLLDLQVQMAVSLAAEPLVGPVRVGTIQDFADTLLADVLARFARLHPQARLEVLISGSAALERAVAEGGLDLALCAGQGGMAALRHEPMLWLGDAELAARDPLPLALLDAPCIYRDAALAALDRIGRRWRIVVATPSLSGLRAAVRAGFAVTCRSVALREEGIAVLGLAHGLPDLPEVSYTLLHGRRLSPAAERLGDFLREAVLVGTGGTATP